MRIHIAAPPEGLIQRCFRCGTLLQDYRDSLTTGDPIWHWWGTGALVGIEGSMTTLLAPGWPEDDDDAVECEAVTFEGGPRQ